MIWKESILYAVFFAGQIFHLLEQATGIAASTLPNGVATLGEYLRQRKWQLVGQVFVALLLFWFVFDNPKLLNLADLGMGYRTRLALAGMLGWFADSASRKLFLRFGMA